MGRIHLLPPLVQNQIAAGEVVERPVSVLKELVENSIDAGASSISVVLEAGGLERIRIEDDGEGMLPDDAALAFTRHATSKITDLEDLQHIQSMGFRGEALASIGSVAKVTLRTRTKDMPAATEVFCAGEDQHTPKDTSGPVGTSIDVQELFFNIPARKKYLRSERTELTHCLRYMTEVGMLYPDLRFSVEHNGKSVLLFPKSSLEERLLAALGKDFLETHLPITLNHPDLSLRGFISKPHVQLTSRNKQFFFVNHRPVVSDILQKAVTSGYHRIVDEGRYPSVVLFVDVHPTLVDVNVHPRKKEVRFHDTQFLFSSTQHAVSQALTQAGHERKVRDLPKTSPTTTTPHVPQFNPQSKASSPYASSQTKKHVHQDHLHTILNAAPLVLRSEERHEPLHVQQTQQPSKEYRVLGQLMDCYILVETHEGLLLVDQHAAHERVLFDRLTRDLAEKSIEVQQLLQPHVLHLTPQDSAQTLEHATLLREAGFLVEELDTTTWSLHGIPTDLSRASVDLDQTFHTILHECEDISTGCGSKMLTDYREKLLAYTACRSAVKFGDRLTQADMDGLIQDLFKTERRYTCPHGRTSIVQLDAVQLKRFFDR